MTPANREEMNSVAAASFGQLPVAEQALIDAACDSFEASWQAGAAPDLARYLQDTPALNLHGPLFRELLRIELHIRRTRGEDPKPADYASRFPQFESILADCFRAEPEDASVTQTWQAQRTKGRTWGNRPAADAFPIAFGEYELLAELGRGGMGVVYRARQAKLNRFVALKITRPDAEWDERAKRYFQNEVEAVAGLDHPGIVPLYELGEENGQLYYTMALVNGPSLRDLLRESPLPAETAAYLIKEVSLAVHAAHERGVIHRDLKPHNILLEGGRRPRVVDFGLAQKVEASSEQTTGNIIGSPSYMPPEQALGKTTEIDACSDVYSLGATLYEAVTARPPFRAATIAETLRQVLDNEPIPPRQLNAAIPRDLETILLKCLHKSPAGRYPTALALAEDLECFLQGQPVLARPITRTERTWRWCRRNRLSAALLALCAVILVVGGSAFVIQNRVAFQRLSAAKAQSDANFDMAVKFLDPHLRNTDSKTTADSMPLVDMAVEAYQQRVALDPRDLRSWRALLRSTGRAAEANRQLGRNAEAVAAARLAVDAARRIVALTGANQDRHTLAYRLEILDAIQGGGDTALAKEVQDIREQAATAEQDVDGAAYGLFLTAFNKSITQANQGQRQEALATISGGLAAAELARKASPEDDLTWRQIENGYQHQAQLLLQMNHLEQGARILVESIGRLQRFIEAHPKAINARQALAEANNRMVLYLPGDTLQFARDSHQARLEVVRMRLQEPAYWEAVTSLRNAQYNLGEALLLRGEFAEGRDLLLTAERLLMLEGASAPQDRLAYTLNLLGQAAKEQKDLIGAKGYLQRAATVTRQRADASPGDAQLEYEALTMLRELAYVEERSGEPVAAIEHLLSAATSYRELAPRATKILSGLGQPICLYYAAAANARAYGCATAKEAELPEKLAKQIADLRQKALQGLRTALDGGFNDPAAKAAQFIGLQSVWEDDDWSGLRKDPEFQALINPVP